MRQSGRAVTERKLTVDEVYSLDLRTMRRDGWLVSGGGAKLRWKWPFAGPAQIAVDVEGEGSEVTHLLIKYPDLPGPDGQPSFEYVDIESTPCHFGGRRYWFVCPMGHSERRCVESCRILYLPYGASGFGCRECHDLTYDCRRMHRESYYESVEKHETAIEKMKALPRPRSPALWSRRIRRMRAAQQAAIGGYGKLRKS